MKLRIVSENAFQVSLSVYLSVSLSIRLISLLLGIEEIYLSEIAEFVFFYNCRLTT